MVAYHKNQVSQQVSSRNLPTDNRISTASHNKKYFTILKKNGLADKDKENFSFHSFFVVRLQGDFIYLFFNLNGC